MSDVHHEGGSTGGDFDLSQFYQIFFEEAGENLDQMEQILLGLNLDTADDEDLNGVFRCAHSVKGGAATFGFTDVAELTHHMESLLDKLRRHELKPTAEMVDVLLESADISRSLLARHQAGRGEAGPPTADLVRRISLLASGAALGTAAASAAPAVEVRSHPAGRQGGGDAPAPSAAVPLAKSPSTGASTDGERALTITIGPLERPEQADAIVELFKDIPGLGQISAAASERSDTRVFTVSTASSNEDLLDLFTFHVSREHIKIAERMDAPASSRATVDEGYGFFEGAAGAPVADGDSSSDSDRRADAMAMQGGAHSGPGYGFFDGSPGAPVASDQVALPAAAQPAKSAESPNNRPKPGAGGAVAQPEAATIRVAISKVDQLINLVGELVITQAMLAQNSRTLDPAVYQQLLTGLADLDRNTRDLQESVMSIRMIPMSIVFSRFPRMLRDLAAKLGKKVDFVTQGEATELDKGLVEKITDPLTHLVRNSCDHGIELPADRIAAGKPETGTITLSASHQGGSIVIEVRDDGRGMSREKILRKARERGLDVSDSMSDQEVWQLIFAPGFSTAEVVTDVSGRGVGMDVVKKNITALNGTVEIDSAEGYGMRVSVRLPLTLAIMDGMSVGVGDEVYILPLSSVVESFQVKEDAVSTVGQGSQLVKVRDEYMPVIELEKVFQVPRFELGKSSDIMVVVEADGSRVALLVDELLGQQQVVVKNLETNYRKVPNVSGATILGDGKVALILDTGALVRRSRH